jgi:hypothetical protein
MAQSAALAGLLAHCGSRSGLYEYQRSGAPDISTAALGGDEIQRLAVPRRCVDDWQVLYEASSQLGPGFALADREILFAEIEYDALLASFTGGLRALGLEGGQGEPRTVSSGVLVHQVWIDGDDVLLLESARFYRVPLAGGVPMPELDGLTPGVEVQVNSVAFQGGELYWIQRDGDGTRTGLWRRRSSDAERELVARLDGAQAGGLELAVGGGHAVLGGPRRPAAVDLDSGREHALATVPDADGFAGVDARGVYFHRTANRTPRGGRALEFEIRRAPVDGSPAVPLWRGRPGQDLAHLWPEGTGWLATGGYYRDDGRPHAVVAFIDANGDAHLLACARDAGTTIVSRPLLFDGTLYLLVTLRGGSSAVVAVRLDAGELR